MPKMDYFGSESPKLRSARDPPTSEPLASGDWGLRLQFPGEIQ